MACPAKPTCGLAMTDAENILPRYIDAIDAAGLGDVDAVIRMTGCPNGCARPPTAEVGIYGYGKNDHVILVGGSREGTRLAHVLYARISERAHGGGARGPLPRRDASATATASRRASSCTAPIPPRCGAGSASRTRPSGAR